MNKIRGLLWTKAVALAVVAVSTVWLAYGCIGIALFSQMQDNNIPEDALKLEDHIQANVAANYGAMALEDAITSGTVNGVVKDPELFNCLEGGSLDYSVQEKRIYLQDGELMTEVQTVYGDESKLNSANCDYSFSMPTTGCEVHYRAGIFATAFTKPTLWLTDEDFYLTDQNNANAGGTYVQYTHRNRYDEIEVLYDEKSDESESEESLKELNQIVIYTICMRLGGGYSPSKTQFFENGALDIMPMTHDFAVYLSTYRNIYMPVFIISLIVLLVASVYLCCAAGYRKDTDIIALRMMDRMPFGIYAAIACTGVTLGVAGVYGCGAAVYERYFSLRDGVLLAVLCIVASALLAAAFGMSICVRIKSKKFWRYTLCYYITKPFRKVGNAFGRMWKTNRALTVGTALVTGALTFLQFMVIGATGYNLQMEFGLFLLYKCIELPLIAWMIWQMERIRQAGRRVAAGDYTKPIDTKRMFPPFREHAENINNISDGVALAVKEQIKSEHLKTELITNVSHDIKTPLTSIINYVDLIKKEKVENQTVAEYVEVLDRQSARLKKLIEDLLEVSKASTGNVEVHLQKCDACVMIAQVVGEYQEKLQAKGLDVVVSLPDAPATIQADGRHLWRVLDNLLSNINKYAQEGTRVYVNVEVGLHQTKMIFKNISKFPLNISSDELMERFVRGDSSRNGEMEGHGLGLSIAQSLTELMGGTLELSVDGDLFKVTVTMKR